MQTAPADAACRYDCAKNGCLDSGCADCKVRLVSVCAALEPHELDRFGALSRPVTFRPKATLFQEGDPLDAVFTLTEGTARLYKLLPDGRRQIVGFAIPGDFLGLALTERFSVSADAVTAVTACRFPRDAFKAYVEEAPHLLRRLHEFAGHELGLAQDQLVLLGRRTAKERVAAFLLGLRDRLGRVGHCGPTLPIPMSRLDMADFLGLTIETVSRTLTRLAEERLILVVPDGVRLMEVGRLKKLAEG